MAIGRIPEAGTGIPESIIAAKGDLIVGTANDTPGILTVGTNGHTLVADSVEATGLKWAAPAGGGKVLQVVSATTTTSTLIASTSLTDTTIEATITPTSATSTILVIISYQCRCIKSGPTLTYGARLLRDNTTVLDYGDGSFISYSISTSASSSYTATGSVSALDSPATTSATTYKLQAKAEVTANSQSIRFQSGSVPSTITLLEIGA